MTAGEFDQQLCQSLCYLYFTVTLTHYTQAVLIGTLALRGAHFKQGRADVTAVRLKGESYHQTLSRRSLKDRNNVEYDKPDTVLIRQQYY